MKTIQKIIQAGFATCALASASMPALSWTVWPNIDFEWYADVGKPNPTPAQVASAAGEKYPTREGYIWAPGHYERTAGGGAQWVAGHWIVDDHERQWRTYALRDRTVIATGPTNVPLDREGRPIPTAPEAYNVDSARR